MIKNLLTKLLIAIYLIVPVLRFYEDDNLHIWVLDVGQGDATLIQTPDKKLILVDTGGSDKLFTELSEVLPFWIRRIDMVVVSHPHQDHIGMLMDVVKTYDVQKIVWFETLYSNSIYDWAKVYRKESPGRFIEYTEDQNINFGEVEIEFLFPELGAERDLENVNNGSVVFLVEYRNFVGIFPGDAENEQEKEIAEEIIESQEFSDGRIVYLKAGHHCSDTSSSEEFLDLVVPDFATCSVGEDNSYGHPSPSTLAEFMERGIEYYRTDLDGTISISTNGHVYEVKSKR